MAPAPGIAFALRCAAQAPLRGRTTLRVWFVFCCTKNAECFHSANPVLPIHFFRSKFYLGKKKPDSHKNELGWHKMVTDQ